MNRPESSNFPHRSNWTSQGDDKPKRPPGLKGKQIGMYYKNLNAKKKEEKREIKLTIPDAVVSSLLNDLTKIENIAKYFNIDIRYTSISKRLKLEKDEAGIDENDAPQDIKNNDKNLEGGEFVSTKTDTVVKEETNSLPSLNIQPTNSSIGFALSGPTTEDLTIKTEHLDILQSSCEDIFDRDDFKLSLRGSGDYKYGYEDIITGSFEEKLDECLAKGIFVKSSNNEIKDLNVALQLEYKDMITKNKYNKMMSFRQNLPTYKKSEELLNVIKHNQVVVISGETGCGKSTQVPQIILDDAIKNGSGANVKILVTQPRRIAASSLAIRVAEERSENLGKSVGYAVRLEKVDARKRGSIIFCTTGILLADLEVNQGLTEYSHVILDEVHERDTHIDISMAVLKKVLKKRKDLKVILMSATIDAHTLSEYYDKCPTVHIEGIAYPVEDVYLEQILTYINFTLPEEPVRGPPKGKHNQSNWQKHRDKRNYTDAKEMAKEIKYRATIAPWLESKKRHLPRHIYRTLLNPKIEELDTDLIYELLLFICNGEPGAILVFLPGIGDITKLLRKMKSSDMFPPERYRIYPLHSKLPSIEQRQIFLRPPDNVRKIIIATNIAETSITIDDIVYVVDCGKIKCSGLNVQQNVSTLNTDWISKANLRQRRGRAGRCQAGVCYHLMTSFRAENLEEQQLPELKRSNLLEPVLTIKRLRLGLAAEAFQTMPAPPAEFTVNGAVKHLQQCGALDGAETLSPLGWHLARLPLHPAAGKLLLLGALLGCLDRAASVAAVWGFKDPFMLVIGKEKDIDATKRRLASGEPSDHVAISEAIMRWEECSPGLHKRAFAFENYLSIHTLELLSDMKKQIGQNLRQMGFLDSGDIKSPSKNVNSKNLSLFKAIVAASLYPNIAYVRWINIHARNPNKPVKIKAYTPEDGLVALHPSSVMNVQPFRQRNSSGYDHNEQVCRKPGANWLVYWLKQRSSNLFLIEVTLVYTLPLLFFGELIIHEADDDHCFISILEVKVRCKKQTTALLIKMRSLLDQVLASKITSSSSKFDAAFEEIVLKSVTQLITAEDEQAQYIGGDDLSSSDNSERYSRKRWY